MLLGVSLPKVIFELLAYLCLGVCVWHAWRQGALRRARLLELGLGVLYGVSLEALTIFQLHAYRYGHFLVMAGPVPICIGVDWGVILYSAMSFAEALPLPRWSLPAVVALLGLNIDLSMDALAIRLDMWHWNIVRLDQQWFGVPFANFYAWMIVLFSASALFWLARPVTMRPGWRGPLAIVGAYLGSLVILAALDELVTVYDRRLPALSWAPPALLIVLCAALIGAGVWWARQSRANGSGSAPTLSAPEAAPLAPNIVPAYFHLFFVAILFISGIATQLPALIAVSLTMLAISALAHGAQAWRLLRQATPTSAAPASAVPLPSKAARDLAS